jgi:hypothetical protein
MVLLMVNGAERYGEFIADLEPKPPFFAFLPTSMEARAFGSRRAASK